MRTLHYITQDTFDLKFKEVLIYICRVRVTMRTLHYITQDTFDLKFKRNYRCACT